MISSWNLAVARGRPPVLIGPGDGVQLAKDSAAAFSHASRRDWYSCPLSRACHRQVVPRQERREERLQPIIVLLEDRVELVIVASGAADAHPEEDLARDVGDVVEDVGPLPATLRWLYS